jgi:hypothetical protein
LASREKARQFKAFYDFRPVCNWLASQSGALIFCLTSF